MQPARLRVCFFVLWPIAIAVLAAGCERPTPLPTTARPAPPRADHDDQLTQVSIINALMLGQYDGVLPMAEVLRYGDFGLGTCDHLDGELIVLDGVAYQARADGSVRKVPPEEKTPFAVVTPFRADGRFPCPGTANLEELEAELDKQLPSRNIFVAIRIDARLRSIQLRSVPRQERPYAPLAEVARRQTTWTRDNVEGTLIGIRCPAWTSGLNVPGYHWHFLSTDRSLGGHVLNCSVREGGVAFDHCDAWLIKLSDTAEFNGLDLNRSLSRELDSVERSRGK